MAITDSTKSDPLLQLRIEATKFVEIRVQAFFDFYFSQRDSDEKLWSWWWDYVDMIEGAATLSVNTGDKLELLPKTGHTLGQTVWAMAYEMDTRFKPLYDSYCTASDSVVPLGKQILRDMKEAMGSKSIQELAIHLEDLIGIYETPDGTYDGENCLLGF